MKSKIAIFASGQGSNTRRMLEYFEGHSKIVIDSIICNRETAGVMDVAREFQVASFYFSKENFTSEEKVLDLLKSRGIDWIVLAGFLLKIPSELIDAFPSRIINIHPALLPKFGGKGMYGDHVHKAVLEQNERKSGISIHYVDANYDTGSLIAQYECEIEEGDNVGSLRAKVRKLEHEHLPAVVEKLVLSKR